jgi:ribosomal protein L40E
MEKLRLRCPSCSKLYEVNSSDIKSHSPQFDCIVCSSRFTLSYSPEQVSAGKTELVFKNAEVEQGISFQQELENQTFAALQHEIENSAEKNSTISCPKCGALNAKKAHECYSCHVLFERLEQLPLDPTLRAQPSLVRKWKNLIMNFDSLELHEDFLKSCHELEALRFAILKYEELQKAQGGKDEVCERMIFKAHGLLQVSLSSKSKGDMKFQPTRESAAKPPPAWHKYVVLTPLTIAFLMIVAGFFNLGLRNLVGAGVAVTLLTLGLTLFWKGRLSLFDFIQYK